MTAPIAAAASVSTMIMLWMFVRRSATERALSLGRVPTLPILCGAVVCAVDASHAACEPATVAVVAVVTIAAIVDARTGLIFDSMTFTLAAASAAIGLMSGRAADVVVGAVAVGGALAALYGVSQRRGIGLGDVKLGIGIGAGLGWSEGMTAIAFAFVAGALYAMTLLARGRADRRTAIAFGPFLATGTYLTLLAPSARP